MQAVQSPAAGQTVVDSVVPKEEVQESLHRYASLSQDQGVTGCDLGAAAPSGCGRFVGSPQAEPV